MGSPLRILHVVVNMNRGGAETLIMNLFRNIDRSKIQFDFLTCKPGVFDEEIMQLGGRIHRIPYISDVGHFHYIRGLNQFFSQYPDYKIIHSHLDKMSGFVLRAAKKGGIPIRISHSHSTRSEGGLFTKIYKSYPGSLIDHNATNLMACSENAAKWLFRSEKVAFLNNGIDTEKFFFSSINRKKVRKDLSAGKNSIVLGHVGRFSSVKNHHFLIDIFSQFQKTHHDSMLVLVGDGPLRAIIEKKVKDLQLAKKVIFTGIRDDIDQLLQAFDLFLFPSLYEGLPISLIEAQAVGLPCIISDHISKEVDLDLDLIQAVSLHDRNKWLEKMLEIAGADSSREIPPSTLLKKGYDIKSTAEWIMNYYWSFFEVKPNEDVDHIYTYL